MSGPNNALLDALQAMQISGATPDDAEIDRLSQLIEGQLGIGVAGNRETLKGIAELLCKARIDGGDSARSVTHSHQHPPNNAASRPIDPSVLHSPNVTHRRGRMKFSSKKKYEPFQGGESNQKPKPRQRIARSLSPFSNRFFGNKQRRGSAESESDAASVTGVSYAPRPAALDPLTGQQQQQPTFKRPPARRTDTADDRPPSRSSSPSPSIRGRTHLSDNRPPSRSGSPFSRPGLQEDDDRDRIATRSPARAGRREASPMRRSTVDEDATTQPVPPVMSGSPVRRPNVDESPGADATNNHRFVQQTNEAAFPNIQTPNLAFPSADTNDAPANASVPLGPRFATFQSKETVEQQPKTAEHKNRRKDRFTPPNIVEMKQQQSTTSFPTAFNTQDMHFNLDVNPKNTKFRGRKAANKNRPKRPSPAVDIAFPTTASAFSTAKTPVNQQPETPGLFSPMDISPIPPSNTPEWPPQQQEQTVFPNVPPQQTGMPFPNVGQQQQPSVPFPNFVPPQQPHVPKAVPPQQPSVPFSNFGPPQQPPAQFVNSAPSTVPQQQGQFNMPVPNSGAPPQYHQAQFGATTAPTEPRFNMGVNSRGRAKSHRNIHPKSPGVRIQHVDTQKDDNGIGSSLSQDTSGTFVSTQPPSSANTSPSEATMGSVSTVGTSERAMIIADKRQEGRTLYMTGKYKESVRVYTEALNTAKGGVEKYGNDLIAVLLSNRAAGLLMLGACQAAVDDCKQALVLASPATHNVPFASDVGPMLRVKLLTRKARALLKMGAHEEALASFRDAIAVAEESTKFSESVHDTSTAQYNASILSQMAMEAGLGETDAKRQGEKMEQISVHIVQLSKKTATPQLTDALAQINAALTLAPYSHRLIEAKVTVLIALKRWRQVAGFCERLAAINVNFDGVFTADFGHQSPFPGVPDARFLTVDFFNECRDEEDPKPILKLSTTAVCEAVLRMPFVVLPYYLRALRLEERYMAAQEALNVLERFASSSVELRQHFAWLAEEHQKLMRTKIARERADEHFRSGDYALAASQYADCLLIDKQEGAAIGDAGGRLHAILYCNQAAALISLSRYSEALESCNQALHIHKSYMKARVRRARCFMHLKRFPECIQEYKQYLRLVEEAKQGPVPTAGVSCLFDGPTEVTEADIKQVQTSLDEALREKRRVAAGAQEAENRRRAQSSYSSGTWYNNSSSSWNNNRSAHERRDDWYQDGGSRRWDPFTSRGRPGPGPRSSSWRERPQNGARNARVSPAQTSSHYGTLGVSQTASSIEIKKAYRKLALKWHPDKNDADGAEAKFREISEAYEVLGNEESRRKYDVELRFSR